MDKQPHLQAAAGMGADLLELMRPRQWIKNIFVLAPVFFAGRMGELVVVGAVLAATAAFCMMSSAVYVLNDLIDMERDRIHPRKKNRPLASGRVWPGTAVALAVALALSSELVSWAVSANVAAVLMVYGLMNVFYSTILKHYPIIDVLIIAMGFVLRVVAGAQAAGVSPSPWLLLTTFLLATVLGLCKRRAELAVLEERAATHRANLGVYSAELLNQLISIATSATIMTYAMYTFSGPQGPKAMVTVPFVMYGLFRYLYLVNSKNEGENPDYILLHDRPFLVNGLLWIAASFAVVYLPVG